MSPVTVYVYNNINGIFNNSLELHVTSVFFFMLIREINVEFPVKPNVRAEEFCQQAALEK